MKRLVLRCLVLSVALALFSCKGQSSEVEVQIDFLGSAERKADIYDLSEVVDMSRDSIINPHSILSFGDYVILADSRTSKALTIYNERTKVYERVISRGNANNEIKYASNLGLISSKDQLFYVRDLSHGRIFTLRIDKSSGESVLRGVSNINKLGKVTDCAFDGNTIVGSMQGSRYRFFVAPTQRIVAARFGDFSAFSFDRDTSLLGSIQYEGKVALDRKNNRMAFLSKVGESLDVIKYADDHPRTAPKKTAEAAVDSAVAAAAAEPVVIKDSIVHTTVYRMPSFNTTEKKGEFTTFVRAYSSRLGFEVAAASENYIYGLYDGRTKAQANRKNSNVDGLIYNLCVFDWDGRFVMHVTSELGWKSISFNDERGLLYCLCMTDTGEYEIRTIDEALLLSGDSGE